MKILRALVIVAVLVVPLWVYINGAFVGDVRICPFWKSFNLGSQPFSAEVWKNDVTKRGDMLRSLASSTRFAGQTPKQVNDLLGEGFDCYVIQDGYPCYAVPLNGSNDHLAFFIDGETVSDVTFAKAPLPILGCIP